MKHKVYSEDSSDEEELDLKKCDKGQKRKAYNDDNEVKGKAYNEDNEAFPFTSLSSL